MVIRSPVQESPLVQMALIDMLVQIEGAERGARRWRSWRRIAG